MKELIVSSVFPNTIANMYDEACIGHSLGKDVYLLDCSSKIGICWNNPSANYMRCRLCESYRKKMLKKIPSGIHVLNVNSYLNDFKVDSDMSESLYRYSSLEDIKHISFKGVNIGYCCLSVYISATRNNAPLIDKEFRLYFNYLLKQTALFTLVVDKILDELNPDEVYVFNGRCTNSRPAIELAKNKGIHFICSEQKVVFPGKNLRRYFYDAMPHSIKKNEEMMAKTWADSPLPIAEKEYLGRRFFDSKIKKVFGGDKNYIINQKDGLLPDDWDETKHNIVIFNSSEDEFSAIGDEYESKQLFNSQLEGIKHMASILENRDDIRLYLKIHPNLNSIQYKYHTDLLKLETAYNSIKVIPGNSDISTYGMMSKADKVIVFGSTSGVEAAYMKKPVILLCGAMYYDLDFCYVPHSVNEFDLLLFDKQLPHKYNDNVLKVGFYWMDYFMPSPCFLDVDRKISDVFGKNHLVSLYPYKKLLGSRMLFRFYEDALVRLSRVLGHYKRIPYREL